MCGKACKGKASLASHRRWKHQRLDSGSSCPEDTDIDQDQGEQTTSCSKCKYCERAFHTVSRKTIHERRVHPREYYADYVPPALSKARWSETEMALVAREDVVQSRLVSRRAKVADIATHFPHRTFDSIKSLRRTEGYRRILA